MIPGWLVALIVTEIVVAFVAGFHTRQRLEQAVIQKAHMFVTVEWPATIAATGLAECLASIRTS